MAHLETIPIKQDDFELEVSGYFEKGTEPIFYPIDNANPGQPDTFEVTHVVIIKGNIMDLLCWCIEQKNIFDFLEEKCIKYLNEY